MARAPVNTALVATASGDTQTIWVGSGNFSLRMRYKSVEAISVGAVEVHYHASGTPSAGTVGIAVGGVFGPPTWYQSLGTDAKTAFTAGEIVRGDYNYFVLDATAQIPANTFFDVVVLDGAAACTAPTIQSMVYTNLANGGGAAYSFNSYSLNSEQPNYQGLVRFFSLGYGGNSAGVGRMTADQRYITTGMSAVADTARGGVTSNLLQVARRGSDIYLRQAPVTGPSDIGLVTKLPLDSTAIGPAGQSTVTMGLGQRFKTSQTSSGLSVASFTMGATLTNSAAQPTVSEGVASFPYNRMQYIRGGDRFVVFRSKPPYQDRDVWLTPSTGPDPDARATSSMVGGFFVGLDMLGGDVQLGPTAQRGAMFAVASGAATVTMGMGAAIGQRIAPTGRATVQVDVGRVTSITSTSAGRATLLNYLAGPLPLGFTSIGRSTATGYLSSPMRMVATSAGRAAVPKNLLAGREELRLTSNGRAIVTMNPRAFGPVPMSLTPAGRAAVTMYLSSRILLVASSNGRAQVPNNYLAGPVPQAWTSRGRAGSVVYQSGTLLFPNITMRGVANWTFGPVLLNGYAHGVGNMQNVRLGGTQHLLTTSNGVGRMNDFNALRMRSNGSAAGTEFDKPPFAFVANAGCRAFSQSYYGADSPYITQDRGTSYNVGVFMYLSSRMGFANSDPNRYHIGSYGGGYGPSTMAGRSTFTFPYEMVAISNAGCLAFHGYRADYAYGASNYQVWSTQGPFGTGYTGKEGVRFTQVGTTYLSARTNSSLVWRGQTVAYSAGAAVYAYLSSRVYYNFRAAGRSTFSLGRVDTVVFNGVGGYQSNYINVPSYDLQEWHSFRHGTGDGTIYPRLPGGGVDPRVGIAGGQAFMSVYSTGNINGDKILPRGVAGGIFTQQGPVYLELTSRGVSGLNSLDVFGFNQAASAHAGCYPYEIVNPANQTVTKPGVEFEQNRIDVQLTMSASGVATMQIEINGVPIIRIRSNGIGRWINNMTAQRDYKGFTSHGGSYGYVRYQELYPSGNYNAYSPMFGGRAYGVVIEQFQRRDADFNGVGGFRDNTLGLIYRLVWQKRGDTGQILGGPNTFAPQGGVAYMTLRDDRVLLEARTETNIEYNRRVPGRFLYAPDVWNMVVNWALKSRSRGRTRVYATAGPQPRPYGDMLVKYYKTAAPGVPDVDGGERPAYGQYWPRPVKLPFIPVRTPYPAWADYEYVQR